MTLYNTYAIIQYMEQPIVGHEVQTTEKQKTVILEIGHADRSLAQFSDMHFTDGLSYIGVDLPADYIGSENWDSGHTHMEEHRRAITNERADESISFIASDARHLPLPADSVDTVFMANVVDSPARIGNDPAYFDNLILSIREVLKPGGTLVVYEDRTPELSNPIYGEIPTREQFKLLGFDVIETVKLDQDQDTFRQLQKNYGMQYPVFEAVLKGSGKTRAELKKTYDKMISDGTAPKDKGSYILFLEKSSSKAAIIPGSTLWSREIIEKNWRRREAPELVKFEDEREAQKALELEQAKRREQRIATAKNVGKQLVKVAKRTKEKLSNI